VIFFAQKWGQRGRRVGGIGGGREQGQTGKGCGRVGSPDLGRAFGRLAKLTRCVGRKRIFS